MKIFNPWVKIPEHLKHSDFGLALWHAHTLYYLLETAFIKIEAFLLVLQINSTNPKNFISPKTINAGWSLSFVIYCQMSQVFFYFRWAYIKCGQYYVKCNGGCKYMSPIQTAKRHVNGKLFSIIKFSKSGFLVTQRKPQFFMWIEFTIWDYFFLNSRLFDFCHDFCYSIFRKLKTLTAKTKL